jgi:hypothetical protein
VYKRQPPILPQQEFFVRVSEPLLPNRVYEVLVTGVVNLNGLPGGGGEATFAWEPADTAGAASDTASSHPDSAGLAPDTTGAVPDTGAVIPPDTGSAFRGRPSPAPSPGRREPLWWLNRRRP